MTRKTEGSARPRWQPAPRFAHAGGLVSLLAAATAAWGESAESANTESAKTARGESAWVPTIRLGFNVVSQDLDATTQSVQLEPNPNLRPWAPVFRDDGSEGTLRNLFFDGEFGLIAPAFYEGGLAPRLFAYAGGEVPFTDTFDALRSVTARRQPLTAGFCGGSSISAGGFRPDAFSCTVQSRNQVTVDGFWYAGLGVDITLPFFGRSVHLRPSLGYFGQRWRAFGQIESAITSFSTTEVTDQMVTGSGSKQIAHGLGPALEMGIEVARVGPVSIDVYLETRFAWMLWGDRQVHFASSQSSCTLTVMDEVQPECRYYGDPPPDETNPNLATPDISGDFSTGLGRFVAQGGAGLRFRWTGSLLGGP